MFTWLRSWLTATARSTYDTTFYAERLKQKCRGAFGHLYGALWLTTLVSCIALAIWMITALPLLRAGIANFKEIAPSLYPPQLIVEIRNGEVSTNVQEPFAIDIPEPWKLALAKEGAADLPHLLVIDTNATAEDFPGMHTIALLTKHSLVIPDSDGSAKFISLAGSEYFLMNKEIFDAGLQMTLPFVDALPGFAKNLTVAIVVILPFVAAGFLMLWYMSYLLFASLLLLLLAKMMKRGRPFGELYLLSLYGLTLPLCYGLLATLLGFHVFLAFTAIYLGWMGYVLSQLPKPAKAKKP